MKSVLFIFSSAILLHASSITIAGLGGLGGGASTAYRINDSGVVAGSGQTSAGYTHAFSASNGVIKDLNGSAGESLASGLNNTGTVVGTSYSNGQAHGTVWSAGQVTDLGAGYATDVNSGGLVVGGNGQAFLESNGTVQELGTLAGGSWSSAYGINDSGTVTGYGNVGAGAFRGFVWTADGGMSQLGTLGGNNSYAMDINEEGQVTGHASLASGYEHAFVTSGGSLTDLGTLGGSSSYGYGINDAGIVVGYSYLAGNSITHAFAYAGGQLEDLNSLLPANSGWVLEQAYGINNLGDIVGLGTFQGQAEAFILDPPQFARATVPEPGSLGLILVGLMGMGIWRVRRVGRSHPAR